MNMKLKGKDGYELTVNEDDLFVIVTIDRNDNGFMQQHFFKRREWETLVKFITFKNIIKIWRARRK